MSKKQEPLHFKVKGNTREITGPKGFFYRTEGDDPIMLAALFELAYATGNREGYVEAIEDMRKARKS